MGKKARGSADFIWSLGLYGASSESALSFLRGREAEAVYGRLASTLKK